MAFQLTECTWISDKVCQCHYHVIPNKSSHIITYRLTLKNNLKSKYQLHNSPTTPQRFKKNLQSFLIILLDPIYKLNSGNEITTIVVHSHPQSLVLRRSNIITKTRNRDQMTMDTLNSFTMKKLIRASYSIGLSMLPQKFARHIKVV